MTATTDPDQVEVATPERVSVRLPIAGIGFRALAYLIDAALLFSVGIIGYFVFTLAVPDPLEALLGLSTLTRVLLAVAGFGALWAYWSVMEVVWHGQTVGKRLMHIRVVRADGSPVTAFESAVRNLLRFVDFLPTCYPVGVITMLVDRQHRRLGDLAAGTVLVREETIDLGKYALGAQQGVAVPNSSRPLTAQEVELVTNFVARYESLEPEARLRIGRLAARTFGLSEEQAQALNDATLFAYLNQLLK